MPWQALLRQWLQQRAAARVGDAVRDVVQGAAVQADAPATDPASTAPCHAAVLFALREEAGGLLDRLTGVVAIRGHRFTAYEGAMGGKLVVVALTGPGGEAAAKVATAIIAGHRPAWVVSSGFAGALTETMRRGGLIVANELVDGGRKLAIDVRFDADWLRMHEDVQVGRLLTVDRVVAEPAEKRRLGVKHAALAVDMESLAVAEVCRQEQARCFVVRAISDNVDEELPREVRQLLQQKTLAGKLGAITGALFRRPGSAKDWWRLREHALAASEKLGAFLGRVIVQLPTPT